MTQPIKVFLGGYLNFVNAQNLNCLALARHLDKSKFLIYSMLHPAGDLEYRPIRGVRVFRAWRPMRVCQFLVYFWGVWKADVVYLPKGELVGFNRFLLKLLRRRSFLTVEGVIADVAYDQMLARFGSDRAIALSYSFTDRTYSISRHMAVHNEHAIHLASDGVLYLGVDSDEFATPGRPDAPVTDVVFIGNDMVRKRVDEFLRLAGEFPHLRFHVVGSGLGRYDLTTEIACRKLGNVIVHGSLTPAQLASLLRDVQLHILPSRSEGFPKVTLETAAAGVPSIVYADYGAAEWITSGENGFVISTYEEMRETLQALIQNPAVLHRVSSNAIRLGKSFDWMTRVKDWERAIASLAN